MPLQKPHPQGTLSADQHSSKRRQLEGRRRTLHTISELCVTDGATPDFSSFLATKEKQQRNQTDTASAKRNTQHLNKRRSLPQYCSSPQCLQAQTSVNEPPRHTLASHRSRPLQDSHISAMRTHEEGWNARRERARIQREQAVEVSYRRQALNEPQDGSYPTLPRKAVSRSSLRSYSSHHQLLANSRSMSGFSSSSSSNGTLDRRSSIGTLAGHSDSRGFDPDASGKASTDSISYQSVHDGTVRRSRSGSSSNMPSPPQIAPPMPIASHPPMQRYYSMPAPHLTDNVFMRQSVNMANTRSNSNARTLSLPTIRTERVGPTAQNHRHRISQQQHQSDVQRARLESLAALTALHPSPSPPHPRRTSGSSQQSQPARPRPYSHLKPPPQYSALPPLHPVNTPTAQPGTPPVEKREVPKRESLTQWKAEREQQAQSGGTRRAHMKERVRRANEAEVEREQELMKLGKGTERKREKETGCFGGVLALCGLGGR